MNESRGARGRGSGGAGEMEKLEEIEAGMREEQSKI
jgi:hypothetical protein